jgi:hypothetical protein
MLCDLDVSKNNKLGILQPFWKKIMEKSYLVRNFMAFKLYELVIDITIA